MVVVVCLVLLLALTGQSSKLLQHFLFPFLHSDLRKKKIWSFLYNGGKEKGWNYMWEKKFWKFLLKRRGKDWFFECVHAYLCQECPLLLLQLLIWFFYLLGFWFCRCYILYMQRWDEQSSPSEDHRLRLWIWSWLLSYPSEWSLLPAQHGEGPLQLCCKQLFPEEGTSCWHLWLFWNGHYLSYHSQYAPYRLACLYISLCDVH